MGDGKFKKGQAKGRPKGAVNKTTMEAKEAIAMVAQGLGGAEGLLEWARRDEKNETIFWGTIYPKLLPLTIAGDKEAPVAMTITREVVTRKV
jgi:hypothetical protein